MDKQKKYEFTGETKEWYGRTLKQIRLLVDIAALGLSAGTIGGWIEGEDNLSQVSGDAWVYGNAWVSGNARVYGDAQVSGNAWVSGDAWVSGNARVYGDAQVSGNAWVYGNARVSGDAQVYGNARVSKVNLSAVRSDGYTFSVCATPDGPRVIAGCRYFTYREASNHWRETRSGTKLGDESLLLIRHLKAMAKLNGLDKPVTKGGE